MKYSGSKSSIKEVLLYAPIGIEFGNGLSAGYSWLKDHNKAPFMGTGEWLKGNWFGRCVLEFLNPSIYIQVIDLSVLAGASIDTSKKAMASQLVVRDLFSPGLGLVWGIGDSPFSFSIIKHSAHNLLNLRSGDLAYKEREEDILFVTLSIDIPLFP